MKFQQFAAPDCLKKYVRYFWTLESDTASTQPQHFRAIADGCPGLIFQHADKGTFTQDNKILPETFLFGQSTKYLEISLTGNFHTIGICFEPHALKSVFGFESAPLTNSCMDINETARKQGFYLSEQLSGAIGAKEKIDLLSAYLMAQICKTADESTDMAFALSEIVRTDGSIPLVQLHQKLQLSERSFERKFKEFTGISPKLFSRICRFQVSLKQLQTNGYDKLSDIAFENNYADQSHFIRAFREFSGFSPYQYKKQAGDVAENLSAIR